MTLVPIIPEAPPSSPPAIKVLDTFRFRDFRLLWTGLVFSNLGTWMQLTALGYLVVRTAPDAAVGSFRLGLVGLSQAIPALVFSPIAGVVADTQPRRRTLLFTNIAAAVIAFLLAIVASSSELELPLLLSLTALNAGVRAFDSPTRQSWVPLLVDRAYVGSAIGLNSIAFNAPSVIGPSIAGAVILALSISGAFYANAVLTLAVVVALFAMRPSPASSRQREPFLTALTRGVLFLRDHPILRWIVLGLLINSLFLRPYVQLLPAFAVHELRTGPRGLGILLGASGIGAVIGASIVAAIGGNIGRAKRWALASAVVSMSVGALALTRTIGAAVPWLIFSGMSTLVFTGTSNILIQSLSPDSVRGRAISALTMIVLGFVPLGTLLLGTIAQVTGLRGALLQSAVIGIIMTCVIWFTQPQIHEV